jgi:outer membrane protein TolC
MLSEMALARRADLKARQLAVTEATANLRLTTANQYGNPIVGPAVAYDPSKVKMIGAQINVPLPVANNHRGEVFQSQAEHALAAQLLRQTEINIRQDVASGLARLTAAESRAEQFRAKLLPDLRRDVDDMEKLFLSGEPGVDVLKVIEVRRSLLKARDSFLDALWSVRQARADVAAAAGEPALSLSPPLVPAEPPARMGVPKP